MHFTTSLDQWYFERYILDVAIATVEKGTVASKLGTYQLLPPIDAWGFPKYPGKTAILSPEIDLLAELRIFIETNETYFKEEDCCLGTWINPHTKHYYLDVTTSCADLDEARQAAKTISVKEGRKIIALYNSKSEMTVYL